MQKKILKKGIELHINNKVYEIWRDGKYLETITNLNELDKYFISIPNNNNNIITENW